MLKETGLVGTDFGRRTGCESGFAPRSFGRWVAGDDEAVEVQRFDIEFNPGRVANHRLRSATVRLLRARIRWLGSAASDSELASCMPAIFDELLDLLNHRNARFGRTVVACLVVSGLLESELQAGEIE